MRRKAEEFIKVTVRLYKGDVEALGEYYPAQGYNWAIRELVRKHLRKLDERSNREGIIENRGESM